MAAVLKTVRETDRVTFTM